jgi:glutathione S-transferase
MAALKLVYFDFPGKAAGLRLAAAYGGLEFEDFRFKERAELTAMKESGELPYGQVPALFVDGQILGQSSAIMRYIGKVGPPPRTWVVPAAGGVTCDDA